MRWSHSSTYLFLSLVLPALTLPASAQFNSSLSGTVEDNAGAVVPGAALSLENTATHVSQSTTSGPQGFYRFSELGPGAYTLTVEAASFKKAVIPVALAAETPRDLDVRLTPGASAETVTVRGDEVPLLQTADASIGSTVTSAEITRLPIFGRDPYELLRTAVGTSGDGARNGTGGGVFLPNGQGPGQSNYGVFQTENQVQISASGQRVTSNTYLIDGVSVDSLIHGGSAIITPNPESVAQVSITSSSYDATEGRNVGAQIKTVTKSGTDSYHGSLFFQYDEPGLNAYQYFGGPTSTPGSYALPQRVNNKQREYAASIGGPILKDKLFLFASYEGLTGTNPTFAQEYVPSPQFIQGLSADRKGGIVASVLTSPGASPNVVQILPPSCSNVQPTPNGGVPVCRNAGNGLDIGSLAGAVGTYLPAFHSATPNVANLLTGGGLDGIPDILYADVKNPATVRGNQFMGRVDWVPNARDRFTLSAFFVKLDQRQGDAGTGAQPISAVPFKPFNSSGTLVYIHTFSPSLINEARANYTRFADNQVADSKGTVNFGIPRFEVQGFPFGRLYSGVASSTNTPGIFAENTYEVRDTLTRTFGTHTLRIGGQLRLEQDNDNLSGLSRPDYVFQQIWQYANDAPIFEQVAANPDTGGVANAQRYYRDNDIAGFVQHDWKVSTNLTLNMGLRYEYFEPLRNKGFKINQPVFGNTPSTYLINARLVPVNHIYNSNFNNWGPKFGFAWTPAQLENRMVLRGGFGVSYDRIDDGLFTNSFENGPGYFQFGLCCGTSAASAKTAGIQFGLGSSDSPFSFAPNPALKTGVNPLTGTPNNIGGSTPEIEIYGSNPRTPQPILYVFSLETQYELSRDLVLSLGYQGSIGHHFPRLVDQNFLYPTQTGSCLATGANCQPGINQSPFNNAYLPTTDVFTNYNGANVHVSKRYNHGFNLDAVYTYSKSLDQGSNEGPGALSNQTDPAHPATEYGPSDFDVRHRFVIDGLWDLPKLREGKGLIGQLLSGWQANGIYTWHTGFPWTPVTGQPSVAVVQSAATIAPIRPFQYFGGASNGCSNSSFINGNGFPGSTNFPNRGATGQSGGLKYFRTTRNYPTEGPGIGRNSFNGPCYMDTDMSFAKEQSFEIMDHPVQVRFQANFYNIFNKTNLQPITFGAPEATIENSLFGLSPGADAGRVLEFFARLQF
ncbi:MAG TPA: carboxypeptidase regulatory-like domain-containing protein [Acidobacteriaceae bacterium]|nr:carboxypeptidase regulatory-like domain-containing protein [Acidobacteriaceae bacterium]